MDHQLVASHVDPLAGGALSPLQSWKHHWVLLNHELDDVNRQLIECHERIARLMASHADDKARLGHQQGRILELEAQLKRFQDKQALAASNEVAGRGATVFSLAHLR
ncbi:MULTISPECIES: hypothetical protein [Pseudomonas]|uniref:Uncharacterized protein n=1 Tax=Pseudomonas quercus TaxID=2722792 RepID=A0ABX0YJB6_9PSED|nr:MULTISPECIES: hypothetical protein [Pseudomonas]MBF7143603.1 hypothetical protein [Pseudomonas sp. LY10J]NJP02269.1 hypothetical protein [Pseudomonas quercus]